MLEKNGELKLTEDDLLLVKQGSVSQRVNQTWGLTLDQLQEAVAHNDYVKIDSINESNK